MITERELFIDRELDSIPVIPPKQSFRDPAYLGLLDEHWRLLPPLLSWGHQIGDNGQEHPVYHAAVRKAARRRRDGALPTREGWSA